MQRIEEIVIGFADVAWGPWLLVLLLDGRLPIPKAWNINSISRSRLVHSGGNNDEEIHP